MTLRVGMVLRGPRGGLREVVGFWWGREMEAREAAYAAEMRAIGGTPPDPDGFWRRVYWRKTPRSNQQMTYLPEWETWSARAVVVEPGDGALAPWEAL